MKKRLLALLLAVCLLCLNLTGCGDDGTGKGFRFPIEAEPLSLDPQTATDPAAITVLCSLFEGLTQLDAQGNAIEGAASWQVSGDGKTYTFTIKDEATWAVYSTQEENPWDTATPVTAADFLFGFQRVLDPANQSGLAAELYGVKNAKKIHQKKLPMEQLGVQVLSDKQLTITLEKADPSFPKKVAATPWFPCKADFFEHTAGRYGLEQEYLLGNGPFRLSAWNHDESLLLYKNEHYHGAESILPEAVRYVIGTEDPVTALEKGELDAALIPAQRTGETDLTLYPLQDTVRSLYFNTKVTPLNTVTIRQALRDSIEWETLFQHLNTLTDTPEAPAGGPVPPAATVGTDTYTRGESGRYRTAVKSAKAAWKKGIKRLYRDAVTKPQLELLAADDPVSSDLARYVAQSWQKNLEFYPTLTLLPQEELESRVRSGNYQAAILTVTPSGDAAGETLQGFSSGSPDNLSRFANKEVNQLVTAAQDGGAKEVAALEKRLWDLCPSIPLSYPTRYYAVAEEVEGVILHPFGGGRYHSPLDFYSARKYD